MINIFGMLLISEITYLIFIFIILVSDHLKLKIEMSSSLEVFIFILGVIVFIIMQLCLFFSLLRVLLNKDLRDLKRLSTIGGGILITTATWLHLVGIFSAAFKPQG